VVTVVVSWHPRRGVSLRKKEEDIGKQNYEIAPIRERIVPRLPAIDVGNSNGSRYEN